VLSPNNLPFYTGLNATGKTLTINGTTGNDHFTFDASSSSSIVVTLNGVVSTYAAGEYTNYVFNGDGGSDTAILTGSASGNSAVLYDGSGQLSNSNATKGYSVAVNGAATIHANGHAGDTAQFCDSPGDDSFYAYADYNGSGQQLAGMYGTAYSNSASGFGTNIGYSSKGGHDAAAFHDSPNNDYFYAYADYSKSGQQLAGMYGNYGGAYTNSANGFGTNLGYSANGGSDLAAFFDSPGSDTFYAYADYGNGGQQLAGMYGSYVGYPAGYSNSASGFTQNVGYATNGGSDLAAFHDSPGADTFYAYANYNGGQTMAGMYGSYAGYPAGYSNSASGFAANMGIAANGGNDTATLVGSSASPVVNNDDSLYTDAAMASLYGNNGAYSQQASGFALVDALGGSGTNIHIQCPDPLQYQLNLIGIWAPAAKAN
jgi:hypothetical protein